jgi:tRNA-splicing ligase RtcB
MNTKDLLQLGVPQGEPMKRAHEVILAFRDSGGDMSQLLSEVAAVVANPAKFLGDPMREAFVRCFLMIE